MSNNNSNNNNVENDKKEVKNDAVTGVEVVKDDTVMYEDGDFEDYNADKEYEANNDSDSDSDKNNKSTTDDKSNKKDEKSDDDSKDKNQQSDENEKSDKDSKNKDSKSDKKDKSSKKDKSDEDDKSGITMASIYQWASKLKDDFKSEAVDITHEVTEKAAAMTLGKLLDGVDVELAAFDKSIEAAKKLIENAEEERKKIASKKDKYQGMIDKLDQ